MGSKLNEKTKETTNLQQQRIDANNLMIKQQKMSEQNFITNERLTSLNTQLFEYIDAKTGEWTEAVTSIGHNKQHNKIQQKATTKEKEADLITTTDNQKRTHPQTVSTSSKPSILSKIENSNATSLNQKYKHPTPYLQRNIAQPVKLGYLRPNIPREKVQQRGAGLLLSTAE